jgi:hypothetical protein
VKSSAETLLAESRAMLGPLVHALIAQGASYPQFSRTMKQVFLEVARAQLRARNQRETDSAVSVLSGVHRKDVRALGAAATDTLEPGLTLVSQIFTRWVTERPYLDKNRQPKVLPRTGDRGSFEALATSISTDVHPRTALEELVRLDVVTVADDRVHLNTSAFVPTRGFVETAALFSRNVADHIAAGAHNLERAKGEDRFLEQSVFAEGLSAESTRLLGEFARGLWANAFQAMVVRAQELIDQDKGKPEADQRFRYGVYFYAAPNPRAGTKRADAAVKKRPKAARAPAEPPGARDSQRRR